MKLNSSTIRQVAETHQVAPRTLLRAVASNWDISPEGANYARQTIMDAANSEGPGMASRGEWADALIEGCLIALEMKKNPFFQCECGCGCIRTYRHDSTYCRPCGNGCCGDD